MTPDEEAKANRQGSLLFALGGREGVPLRAVRLMEHSCRWQLYYEKRSRDGRGTGETACFLLGFGEFLPSSKRDLLSRQYGFAGDCTVFRLGPSLFRHGLWPRRGCLKIAKSPKRTMSLRTSAHAGVVPQGYFLRAQSPRFSNICVRKSWILRLSGGLPHQ